MSKIGWIAALFTLIGQTLISLGIENLILAALISFSIGNFLWTYYAYKTKQGALLTLNIVFIFVTSMGIYNWT